MKKLLIAISVLVFTFAAQAVEIKLINTELPNSKNFTTVEASFFIDTNMREGFAKVFVQEEEYISNFSESCARDGYNGSRGPSYPGPQCNRNPTRTSRTLYSGSIKIDGLVTNGNEVIYQGANGDVVCGKMKTSRIFKVPTFYLSGKCTLKGSVKLIDGTKKLTVIFKAI